jgi:hypothetical protein
MNAPDQAQKFLDWIPTATKEEIEQVIGNNSNHDRGAYAKACDIAYDIAYASTIANTFAVILAAPFAAQYAFAYAAIAKRDKISVEDFETLIAPIRFILERLEIVEPISEVGK